VLAGRRVTSMMRTVILSVLLAVVCGSSYGGNSSKSGQDPQKPPEQTPPAVQSPKPANASAPAPEAVKPPAATTPETDPTKMAAPSSNGGDKVTGATMDKSYVIGVDDVLQIVVWGNSNLSSSIIVRPDGKISLGLIGEITASGLTPVQLGQQITDRLKEGGILRAPQVTIIISAVNSKKFSILGEVGKPGNYSLTVPTNVIEALVNAGGFKDFANKKKIIIQRGEKRFTFNYNQVIQGKHREQNIQLEPGDLIIVK